MGDCVCTDTDEGDRSGEVSRKRLHCVDGALQESREESPLLPRKGVVVDEVSEGDTDQQQDEGGDDEEEGPGVEGARDDCGKRGAQARPVEEKPQNTVFVKGALEIFLCPEVVYDIEYEGDAQEDDAHAHRCQQQLPEVLRMHGGR